MPGGCFASCSSSALFSDRPNQEPPQIFQLQKVMFAEIICNVLWGMLSWKYILLFCQVLFGKLRPAWSHLWWQTGIQQRAPLPESQALKLCSQSSHSAWSWNPFAFSLPKLMTEPSTVFGQKRNTARSSTTLLPYSCRWEEWARNAPSQPSASESVTLHTLHHFSLTWPINFIFAFCSLISCMYHLPFHFIWFISSVTLVYYFTMQKKPTQFFLCHKSTCRIANKVAPGKKFVRLSIASKKLLMTLLWPPVHLESRKQQFFL